MYFLGLVCCEHTKKSYSVAEFSTIFFIDGVEVELGTYNVKELRVSYRKCPILFFGILNLHCDEQIVGRKTSCYIKTLESLSFLWISEKV